MILFRALAKAPAQRFQSMNEFRQALLDPEGYASATPIEDASKDMTERVRIALPMARTEMSFRPASASQPQYVDGLGRAPSTFRDSAGEVWVREDEPKLERHRARNTLLVGMMLAGVAVAGWKYRNQARTLVEAAAAPVKPSTVRVNFNSDPDGATVVAADGTVLGVTPLSTDVIYGDKPIEYVIRLEGYVPRTTSIVPNLPSPVFAVLQRDQPLPSVQPDASEVKAVIVDVPATADPEAAAKKREAVRSARRRSDLRAAEREAADSDSDETLKPTAP